MTYETNARHELRERAQSLSEAYEGQAATEVLKEAARGLFPGRIGLVSSFGTEAAVLLHMVSRIDPDMPVIFIDTRKHFDETIAYRDDLAARLGLRNLRTAAPAGQALAHEDPDGTLHQRDPDLCCHVRKTIPMRQALSGLDCWITGRKRRQAATRSDLSLFEQQERWIKINPLMDWTPEDIAGYFEREGLPRHPLEEVGYPSVGCAVCTQPVAAGDDPRSGRWADSGKTECGIHFENGRMVRG
ncbi:phosphoadenylyl-sulfate reductase [Pseudoroseicyclus aestuarii]|uniref:Adenosine 5'-phosphosulfate reductase n=1 Tax=Pseudoroseicyclus aestuarii TaxID=1795041 RepID=A0A318SSQ7_9RHOB|nr:phosphoadenylyl-sulfate reductase [Pseudoroseicyclus aestuarii]PYE82169.1 phosphoadenylylsulfate reductase (thioredoxin) [Pseudoroseicyclus aestuarii]